MGLALERGTAVPMGQRHRRKRESECERGQNEKVAVKRFMGKKVISL